VDPDQLAVEVVAADVVVRQQADLRPRMMMKFVWLRRS
jgi:hypothetical protein